MDQANQRYTVKTRLGLVLFAAALLFSAGSAAAVEKPGQNEDILLGTYLRNKDRLARSSFGVPLFLESVERDDKVHADVYGIFEYPFSSVVNVLKTPANWCDILSLHPNVKACAYRELPDAWLLTFYIGRKVYQPPEATRQVVCQYRNVAQQQGYLDICSMPMPALSARMTTGCGLRPCPLTGEGLLSTSVIHTATVSRFASRKSSILRPSAGAR